MREFSVVLRGYSRREVEDLFSRIDATLSDGAGANGVTVADVKSARFHKQTRGYAPHEVDAAIDQAIRELELHES
jgi:DivIVA domain-containing protein